MGIGTKDEYIDRLSKQKLRAYMAGEKIGNIVDEPSSRVGINAIGISFESANNPSYSDLATITSPLINEKISRWTYLGKRTRCHC
jgi:4-hydroxyphenylacetate 3-monooxygenase/4-hydroxybutyryl-CoA dehydratase/vinylacetyl-CoA-Delta-isomerase